MTLGTDLANKTNSLNLPIGEPRLLSIEKIIRPAGYSIPGYSALCATLISGKEKVLGFGEGPYELALRKAISEATERSVLKIRSEKSLGPESSNGWACHSSPKLAIESAILELIERDVALSNWESNGPFYEIPEELYPLPLKAWKERREPNLEFGILRIFISQNSNGACISSLLFNERGNFVVGHASSIDLSSAILSSTCEAMRAAHAALRFENFKEVEDLHTSNAVAPAPPGTHSLAYAYNHKAPASMNFKTASVEDVLKMWNEHYGKVQTLDHKDLYIELFEVGELFVARVRSNRFRSIHWGTKLIPEDAINKTPHFVG